MEGIGREWKEREVRERVREKMGKSEREWEEGIGEEEKRIERG
jgi:hypothetical protein